MIRFLREKFRGSLERKHRKLHAEIMRIDSEEKRLAKRKKKVVAQIILVTRLMGER